MDVLLSHKTAVVCGSTQGIGKAAAMEIAALGATVVLMARNAHALEQVCAELPRNHGQKHRYLVADFSQPEQVRQAIVSYAAEGGDAHILVNNTGGPAAGLAIEAKPEAFVEAFLAHIVTAQHLAQALVPSMKASGYGRIINIISTSVKAPIPGLGVSNTIRGAMANWAKTMAMELGPFGITVNNVLPGLTLTGRLDSLIEGQAKQASRSPEAQAEALKLTIPLRRFATAQEVGGVVAFLASPAAAYISGINLPVDGGRTPSL